MIGLDMQMDTRELDQWRVMTEQEQRAALQDACGKYLQLEVENLNRGRDVHGSPMKPYSPAYAARKALAGRMGKSYWMRLSGDLLRSQVVKIVRDAAGLVAVIAFEGMHAPYRFRTRGKSKTVSAGAGTQTPNALIAAVNDMIRPFVGVNPKMLEQMVSVFKRALRRARGK